MAIFRDSLRSRRIKRGRRGGGGEIGRKRKGWRLGRRGAVLQAPTSPFFLSLFNKPPSPLYASATQANFASIKFRDFERKLEVECIKCRDFFSSLYM